MYGDNFMTNPSKVHFDLSARIQDQQMNLTLVFDIKKAQTDFMKIKIKEIL